MCQYDYFQRFKPLKITNIVSKYVGISEEMKKTKGLIFNDNEPCKQLSRESCRGLSAHDKSSFWRDGFSMKSMGVSDGFHRESSIFSDQNFLEVYNIGIYTSLKGMITQTWLNILSTRRTY